MDRFYIFLINDKDESYIPILQIQIEDLELKTKSNLLS